MRYWLIAIISWLCLQSGCAVVSYHANSYGKKAERGEIFELPQFQYRVTDTHMRVWSGENDLIAYEDYGVGMGRGRVFVVRTGPEYPAGEGLIPDLSQFESSSARVLKDAVIISTAVDSWKGQSVELHLLQIPEISRQMSKNSKIVSREEMWILGMTVPIKGARLWISLTSNDEYFRVADGIRGRNLESLLKFADGLTIKAD